MKWNLLKQVVGLLTSSDSASTMSKGVQDISNINSTTTITEKTEKDMSVNKTTKKNLMIKSKKMKVKKVRMILNEEKNLK